MNLIGYIKKRISESKLRDLKFSLLLKAYKGKSDFYIKQDILIHRNLKFPTRV